MRADTFRQKGFTVSKETSQWLNTMILVGFTDKRGFAWHYRLEDQGDESNHYPGAIPVDDVNRRLFDFTVDEQPVYILTDSGYQEIPGRKAMVTSDSEDVLGIFKEGYSGHEYSKWLLENVATIIDDDLGIGSAGLLRNRAQAFVSIEVPESIDTPEGVTFRPNLLACTSFDGSLATTFKRVFNVAVCDNTLAGCLSEDGETFKLKHTRYSGLKIADAREALSIVHSMSDEFSAEVAKLCAEKVDDSKFRAVLNTLVPIPDDEGRGKTIAENKQGEIISLYRSDARVAPWNGTAFGVIQAFNTWNTHKASVRKGTPRYMRNMENVLNGKAEKADSLVLSTLAAV
jgi:phage/plasmid-like protein (TIGR03299 family)